MDESWNDIILTRPKSEQFATKLECHTQAVNETPYITTLDHNGSQLIQDLQHNQNSLMTTNDEFATLSIIRSMFSYDPYYTYASHIDIMYFRF